MYESPGTDHIKQNSFTKEVNYYNSYFSIET
jgi:hypothetical protein